MYYIIDKSVVEQVLKWRRTPLRWNMQVKWPTWKHSAIKPLERNKYAKASPHTIKTISNTGCQLT